MVFIIYASYTPASVFARGQTLNINVCELLSPSGFLLLPLTKGGASRTIIKRMYQELRVL